MNVKYGKKSTNRRQNTQPIEIT